MSRVWAGLVTRLPFATEDVRSASLTAQARSIFVGLQKGTLDRSLFTPNANDYFNAQALGAGGVWRVGFLEARRHGRAILSRDVRRREDQVAPIG